jgi:hypothetical protein
MRGQTREERGDRDGAVADYTTAVNLAPDLALSRLTRGMAYARRDKNSRDDADAAIADLILARDGKEFGCSLDRKGALLRLPQPRLIREPGTNFDPREVASEELSEVYLTRGMSLILSAMQTTIAQEEKAKRLIKEVKPQDVRLGIHDLDQVVTLRPNSPVANCWRGIAYNDLGQCLPAKRDLEVALRLPGLVDSTRRIASKRCWRSRENARPQVHQSSGDQFHKVVGLQFDGNLKLPILQEPRPELHSG